MRSLIATVTLALVTLAATARATPPERPWDLARAVVRQPASDEAALLAVWLAAPESETRTLAAKLVRVIGVGHPSVFLALLSRAGLGDEERAAVRAELERMPLQSPSRARLLALLQAAGPLSTAASAR